MSKPACDERARFLRHVAPSGDCWLWTGFRNAQGYGEFHFRGHARGAHRVAYRLFVGEIPRGHFVCHHCDVPACVNPSHLFTGTQKDNMRDAAGKGRIVVPRLRGERVPGAKLTPQLVRYVRESPLGCRKLAKELGVCKTSIKNIRTGKTWAHV